MGKLRWISDRWRYYLRSEVTESKAEASVSNFAATEQLDFHVSIAAPCAALNCRAIYAVHNWLLTEFQPVL